MVIEECDLNRGCDHSRERKLRRPLMRSKPDDHKICSFFITTFACSHVRMDCWDVIVLARAYSRHSTKVQCVLTVFSLARLRWHAQPRQRGPDRLRLFGAGRDVDDALLLRDEETIAGFRGDRRSDGIGRRGERGEDEPLPPRRPGVPGVRRLVRGGDGGHRVRRSDPPRRLVGAGAERRRGRVQDLVAVLGGDGAVGRRGAVEDGAERAVLAGGSETEDSGDAVGAEDGGPEPSRGVMPLFDYTQQCN
ncbi:hypothetical protein ACHAWF_006421 [Thalassiosira exigua]